MAVKKTAKNEAGQGDMHWSSTVRPPRLGGNKRMGVFATRSPYRPNPVGLSVVELEGIRFENGAAFLDLRNVDLLEGTPVLDIKPYLPYADAISDASSGYASEPPVQKTEVVFTELASRQCEELEVAGVKGLRQLVEQVLSLDPRPAYHAGREDAAPLEYGMKLYDFDLRWRVKPGVAEVLELKSLISR